jgi:hypothetical protein
VRRVNGPAAPPTPTYHRTVVDRLRALEPASWSAFASAATARARDLHDRLLRSAYRLDPAGHADVADAAGRAAAALGVDVPVTVYQLEGGTEANAMLLHAPDEAVVALTGNLLALLSPAELTAVLGHELTHHVLWTRDGGDLFTADRLLDALALDARTPPAYLETARRWALATELAADRGALAATGGDLAATVTALVKTATGLATVDPQAVLGQARELDRAGGPGVVAAGRSHPETVLRAWALQRWSESPGAEADEAVGALLGGALDVEALDLADRERLETLTRRVVEAMLAPPGLRTDAVLAHARLFFPDVTPADGAAATFQVPARLSDATRQYLGYVLLDLATVDPDLEDTGLLAALTLAARSGLGDAVAGVAAREKVLPAGDLDRLSRMATAATGEVVP